MEDWVKANKESKIMLVCICSRLANHDDRLAVYNTEEKLGHSVRRIVWKLWKLSEPLTASSLVAISPLIKTLTTSTILFH